MLERSSITVTYLNSPKNFDFQEGYRNVFEDFELASNPALNDLSGLWALSRAEMFPSGTDDPSPFECFWTSKLRPLSVAGDLNEAGVDVNAMFHDVAPFLTMTAGLEMVAANGVGILGAGEAAIYDSVAMEKMTRTMGPSSDEGLIK